MALAPCRWLVTHAIARNPLRKPRLSIRGEKLANVLLLACCYQEVSVRHLRQQQKAPMRRRFPLVFRLVSPLDT
jgi:hypothetical protein